MMLSELIAQLKQTRGILHKQDIQIASRRFLKPIFHHKTPILRGDDCAAIPEGSGYSLLASEGMLPDLVKKDPWFAGWCAVLVNVSDIYAMGGRPLAVVDTLWSSSIEQAEPLWEGMLAASQALDVPIVGGHTNCHSDYAALSVAILGRAKCLITSFQAQPGDQLLLVVDLQGQPHPCFPYCWDAATRADPRELQEKLELLPLLAEQELCDAGKDISMGGIAGTVLMLLETSRGGAVLDLDAIPCPAGLDFRQWLLSFPSYGFILSIRPHLVEKVQSYFHKQEITTAVVGEVQSKQVLELKWGAECLPFWDFREQALTGFAGEV